MSTDETLDRILDTFPGSELVDGDGVAAEAPESASAASGGKAGSVRPRRPPRGPTGELVASVEAMIGWFRENEPARLERAGWKRIVAAIDAVVDLDDPGHDEVQLRMGASETERAAAWAALPASGSQRRTILDAIEAEDGGLCDHEIEARLGMNSSSVRPRRGELVSGGWVEDSGLRRLTPSGAEAVVWALTATGRRRLETP